VFEFGSKPSWTRTDGVLVLDHKEAGTGYSWSDDIAGVVKSAYAATPLMELL
jgi:hypothetical protein